jgi:hypothetical protein
MWAENDGRSPPFFGEILTARPFHGEIKKPTDSTPGAPSFAPLAKGGIHESGINRLYPAPAKKAKTPEMGRAAHRAQQHSDFIEKLFLLRNKKAGWLTTPSGFLWLG